MRKNSPPSQGGSSSKRIIAGLSVAVLIVVLGWGLMRQNKTANLRQSLPPQPDLSSWSEAISEMVATATTEISIFGDSNRGLEMLGMTYHANRFFGEAIEVYQLLKDRQPENPRWPYLMADVYASLNDFESSLDNLKEVNALNNAYCPSLLKLGALTLKMGNSETALKYYGDCLDKCGENGDALFALARHAFRQGQLEDTIGYLERAISADPEFVSPYMLLASVYRRQGENSQAQNIEKKGMTAGLPNRIPPDPWLDQIYEYCFDDERLTVLADQAIQAQRLDDAIHLLDKSLLIEPSNWKTHSIKGNAHKLRGEIELAARSIRKAINLGADEGSGYQEIAAMFLNDGQLNRAETLLREAISNNPNLPETHHQLGLVLLEKGEQARAIKSLLVAESLQPDSASILSDLGQVLWEKGAVEEAVARFHRATELSPIDSKSRTYLVQYYEDRKLYEQAEPFLEEALTIEPDNKAMHAKAVDFFQSGGTAAALEEKYERALHCFERASQLAPENTRIQQDLAKTLFRTERQAEGEAILLDLIKRRKARPEVFMTLGELRFASEDWLDARSFFQQAISHAKGINGYTRLITAAEARILSIDQRRK